MTETHQAASAIREALAYDPDTGGLTWLKGQYKGDLAGCRTKDGYWQIRFDKQSYYAHRIVWLFHTGAWPSHQIDHCDGDRLNNRATNLRLATHAENAQNRVAYRTNKSGYLGVCKSGNHYLAQIQVNGQHRVLGKRATPADAYELYLAAKSELHSFQPSPRSTDG